MRNYIVHALFVQENRGLVYGGLVAALTACGVDAKLDAENAQVGGTEQSVVYGVDDRQDVPWHADPSMRRLAEASTVTLMGSAQLDLTDPNGVKYPDRTLQQTMNLCANEMFLDDPAPGLCSGTLIGDDLVLTAGHCVDAASCAVLSFVFNFRRDADMSLHRVTSDDVFRCRAVIAREEPGQGNGLDYAIVQLDRPATPRFTPAPVRSQATTLAVDQSISVIGSPSGIPHKITDGAIRDPRADHLDFFVANPDTFQGNSGSGGYETTTYQLSGILVSGETDYVARGNCNVVKNCAEDECLGESLTYVHRAVDRLCASQPNHPLCKSRLDYTYTTANCNSATRNTYNRFIYLAPGQTIDYGTCGVPGSSGTGDTYVRLFSPSGVEVSSSDDNPICSLLSLASYTVPADLGGLYQVRAGCFGTNECSGTLAYTVSGPNGGRFTYDASHTNDAKQSTRNVTTLSVRKGDTVVVGTCGVEFAQNVGDTYLRLYADATQVAESDDGCGNGSRGSLIRYTATSTGPLTIRAGCYSALACSGTVAYTIEQN